MSEWQPADCSYHVFNNYSECCLGKLYENGQNVVLESLINKIKSVVQKETLYLVMEKVVVQQVLLYTMKIWIVVQREELFLITIKNAVQKMVQCIIMIQNAVHQMQLYIIMMKNVALLVEQYMIIKKNVVNQKFWNDKLCLDPIFMELVDQAKTMVVQLQVSFNAQIGYFDIISI